MKTSLTYKITKTPEQTFLSSEDSNLLNTKNVFSTFDPVEDSVEFFIFSEDRSLLSSDINLKTYRVVRESENEGKKVSAISIDPLSDVKRLGYGTFNVFAIYNILNRVQKIPGISPYSLFFIESISPDRTEVRVSSLYLNTEDFKNINTSVKNKLDNNPDLQLFFLNFGENNLLPVTNIGTQEVQNTTFLKFKLYKPLPVDILVKSTFSLDEKKSESIEFLIDVKYTATGVDDILSLRGPNFDIELDTKLSNPSKFFNKTELEADLVNKDFITKGESNLTEIDFNVDYTDYKNFIHFSSAEKRIKNFRKKLEKIENLQLSQSLANNIQLTTVRDSTISFYNNEINTIVKGFDHYDKFLFFESGSLSWPKTTVNSNVVNQSITSSQSIDFFNQEINRSYQFDLTNTHRLVNSIPTYIRDDETNEPYLTFVDMVGQAFDNVWLYSKILSEKYNTDNRIEYGISKDLIADTLRNFGVKLYASETQFQNLFRTYTGEFFNTGSEVIDTFITASNTPVAVDTYQKEIYKRLYHNLPFLLKSKGTEKGIKSLLNIFGVPESILKIKYFGGIDTTVLPFLGPDYYITGSLNKINITDSIDRLLEPTLSYFTPTEKQDRSFTENTAFVEVGFSPSDEVDKFLLSGSNLDIEFNIDEYIGDPRLASSNSYKNLDKLATDFLQNPTNFTKNYNVYDFIRLVKFYDNSLFRMIKDFAPARANLNTGVIIRPFLLDRSKVAQTQVEWNPQRRQAHENTVLEYTGSLYSNNFSYYVEIDTAFLNSNGGGSVKEGVLTGSYSDYTIKNGYDTSFTYLITNDSGSILIKKSRDEAKYTGEFGKVTNNRNGILTTSTQNIPVTTGNLNFFNIFKKNSETVIENPIFRTTKGTYSFSIFPTAETELQVLFIADTGTGDQSGNSIENKGSSSDFQEFLNSLPDVIKIVDDITLTDNILYTGSINILLQPYDNPVSLTTGDTFTLSEPGSLTFEDVEIVIPEENIVFINTGSQLTVS